MHRSTSGTSASWNERAVGSTDRIYWPLDGTQATGDTRTFGAPETYGLLDPTWTKRSLPELDDALKPLIPSKEGP